MDERTDAQLVVLASDGDQAAFATLYDRYFDPVYNFLARMLRDADEAADLTQDTFIKAMGSLATLKNPERFKSWVFTIARNRALNRIEQSGRTRPLAITGDDGETVDMDVVDADRFSDPEEAAGAAAMATLVWQAAAGLDPKQLSILQLHLQQGLESAEIADVMGVSKNNGYVMLNRMKKAVEDAIGAFVMFKEGRNYCDQLDSALVAAEVETMTPEVRRVVSKHVKQCEACEERKKNLVSPLAVFGGFVAIGAPPGVKAKMAETLATEWASSGPGSSSSAANANGNTPSDPGAFSGASSSPSTGSPGASGAGAGGASGGGVAVGAASSGGGDDGGFFRGMLFRIAGGVAVLAGLAALFLVPASPLALNSGDDGDGEVILADALDETPTNEPIATTTPSPTPEPTSTNMPVATDANTTPSPAPTQPPTATPSPTPDPQQSAPGPTEPGIAPPPPATSTSTPAPPTPTSTPAPPTPTSTLPPSPSPSPTRVNPTATPTPCVAALVVTPGSLSVPAGTFQGAFLVDDTNDCGDGLYNATTTTPWLSLPASIGLVNVPAGVALPVNLGARPLASLKPGTYTGQVTVENVATGATTTVSVIYTVPVPPTPTPVPDTPPVVNASYTCLTRNFPEFSVTASDDNGVMRVSMNGGGQQFDLTLASGTPASGTWTGTGSPWNGPGVATIRVYDASGQTTVSLNVDCT